MKFLIVLALFGACLAAEDQKADDATFVSTYAAHPYAYGSYPYSYGTYGAYSHPSVYSTYAASPLTHSYGYSPLVHTLKKRDTAAAEDQKADDATFVSTYAAHPYAYGSYPYSYGTYGAYSHPSVYSTYAASPLTHSYGYSPLVHTLKKRDTAAAEDQKADDATFVSTYAAHPYAYGSYPYSYGTYGAYSHPSVYSTYAASPLTHSYGYSPLVHTLKKRDTAAAEDQKADDATFVSTYAAHPYAYGSYPYSYGTYGAYSHPSVYSTYAASPLTYNYGYSPLIHSLKKRDTAAAEDQKADDATLYTTYAGHPYAYSAYNAYSAYPYNYATSYAFNTPASTVPLAYSSPAVYHTY